MKIRTLIVDDEPLARLNLSGLLEEEPDFDVVGQSGDGRSALQALAALHPDLVFLDVQMPQMSGLDVLDALPADHAPAAVLVTAYDQYAVRAFEVPVLDYLLKPFRRDRFDATLQRVRDRFSGRAMHPPGLSAQSSECADRMVVKCGDRVVFVHLDELQYIRAAANYVQLHLTHHVYEVREKISTMASRLPADRFLRIHRSYVVNLAAVQELYPVGGGEYMMALRGGKQLPVGPTYPPAIRYALNAACLPRFGGAA